jgi:membrane-associated phospholipid phosphatase
MTGDPPLPRKGSYDRAASLISALGSAPLIAVITFLFISFLTARETEFLLFSATGVLFAGIIPILLTIYWSMLIRNIPYDIPEKGYRTWLLLMVIGSYGVGATAFFLLQAPWLLTGLMICYCTNTIVVLVVNLWWKISVHAMGIAGPMAAVIFAVGLPGLLFLGFLLPVMWSRVHLRRHTLAQVVIGAVLGFILTGIQLFLLRPALP